MTKIIRPSECEVHRPYWERKAPPVYRAVIRDFGNGQAEVLTHLVTTAPTLEQLRDRDAAAAGIPCVPWRKSGHSDPEPLSDTDREKNHARACRRAKQSVRWRIKGQSLDHMLTLTIRENLTDRSALKAAWSRFLRLFQERNGGNDWPYVATVETQERGALHLHVAVKGRQDVHKIRGLWWRALGARVSWSKGVPTCEGSETPGNIDMRGPRNRGSKWRARTLASYLAKYIGKEVDAVGKSERKYWAPTGWVCPKRVVYLKADTLLDALIETADYFEAAAGFWGSPWRSPDWSCLWVST